MRRVWIGVLVAASCARSETVDNRPAPPPAFAPGPAPAPSPPPPIDPSRACGEPGPAPTALPPKLLDGMASQGDGVVELEHATKIGGVEASYKSGIWIGSMERGHRGTALVLTIDRAEANGGAWGTRPIELAAKMAHRATIGPYRIDVVASDEKQPSKVTIHVDRIACPDHLVIPPPPGPISLWVSTEAIQLATIDAPGDMLQLGTGQFPKPYVAVSTTGFRQTIALVPGLATTVRVGSRMVTLDAIEPGRGTHFDGRAWLGDNGPPKLSARVRVDSAAPIPLEDAGTQAAACGDVAASRSKLPVELTAIPKLHGTVTIASGQTKTIDGIELKTYEMTVPPRSHRDKPTMSYSVSSESLDQSVSWRDAAVTVARAPKAVVTLESIESPKPSFRVKTYPIACTRDVTLPIPDAPTYVWLSTIGHKAITFGATTAPALRLTLDGDRDVTWGATSPDGYANRQVDASLIGYVTSLDDLLVQVTDVVLANDPRVPFPIAHVQLRVWRP